MEEQILKACLAVSTIQQFFAQAKMESRDLEMGERMSNNKTMVDIIPEVYQKIRVQGVVVFDMLNPYR